MAASRSRRRPWYYRLPRRLRLHLVFLRQRWPYYLRLLLGAPIELPKLLFFKAGHILREVRIIDNCTLTTGGRYNRLFRSCEIDFPRYRDTLGGYLHPRHRGTDEYQRSLALYAASLIHEATHGKFDSHSVFYTAKNRLRIERICHQEEARFYARLEQANPDVFVEIGTLLQPFQEEYYQRYWQQSRWELAKHELARLRESWQDFGARERQLEEESR